MKTYYRLTPIDKKSIEFSCDAIAEDGRTCRITQLYSYGQGFLPLEGKDESKEPDAGIECDLDLGWGAELDVLEATRFDFDDSFTEIDKQAFQQLWIAHDIGLDDQPEYGWHIDNYRLVIYGPARIDLVSDDQTVLKANVNLSQ
jgi:hypothetical protein